MKIKKLIKELQKIKNQNAEVIVSSDSEGNGFAILRQVGREKALYSYEDNQVELYDEEDDYKPTGLKEAIVLWPT